MNYDDYFLSVDSCYLPELGECEKCPFMKKCNGGEKCLMPKSQHKHRDRRAYYQQKKLQAQQLAMEVQLWATKQYMMNLCALWDTYEAKIALSGV